MEFVKRLESVRIGDVELVGGKNASLGEMIRTLADKGVRVPSGFAVTAEGYRYFIEEAGLDSEIRAVLKNLDTRDLKGLASRGAKTRRLITNAELPKKLQQEILDAYGEMEKEYGPNTDVAVRSSATAEDLPDASFAGQQETYLNVRGRAADAGKFQP